MGNLIPATEEHAFELAPRLRSADMEEIRANSGSSPFQALRRGVLMSDTALSLVGDQGELVGMAGVVPSGLDDLGVIWMLASDDLLKYRIKFLRQSAEWVKEINEIYPILFNVVDARNTKHIQWLRWLGFKFFRLIPEYGCGKKPFYEFARIRNV